MNQTSDERFDDAIGYSCVELRANYTSTSERVMNELKGMFVCGQ